jgi:Rrf2 family iron-sulfur cluster assembly transcriptional regulator
VIITREADYAVRLMVGLAAHPVGTVVSARDLATESDVPYELARTILGNLGEAGLLDSKRGRSGGFCLALPPSGIHLAEILSVAGENLQLNVCVSDSAGCLRAEKCPVHPVWTAASANLRAFLGQQTLADILNLEPADTTC